VTSVDIIECDGPNRCTEICINTVGSYECTCSDSGETALANGSCVGNKPDSLSNNAATVYIPFADINECDIPGICDHMCHNTYGGYYCTCPDGYRLVNGHRCSGMKLNLLS